MPIPCIPEPTGRTTLEAFPAMRRLCAESNVIGVEVVELAPEHIASS